MKRAITNFWDLKLKAAIDWTKILPEEAEAQALFENHSFTLSVNRKIQDFWRGSQFENLGDILSQQRTLLSKVEISHKLSVIDPALSKAALIYRSNQLFNLIKKIPQEVTDAVTKDISPIVSGELICWQPYDADPTSDDSGWRYGRTLDLVPVNRTI